MRRSKCCTHEPRPSNTDKTKYQPDHIDSNLKPLISIITVVFNGEQFLEKTIQSTLNQTYVNKEYLILDGKSTDSTIKIIEEYEQYINFWKSEKDDGIYDAMNKSIKFASGDWLIFLNAGDAFYSSNTLAEIASTIEPDIDIIYGDVIIDNGHSKTTKKAGSLNQIWRGLPFSHQSSVVRSSIFQKIKFDTSYDIAADYKFFAECISKKINFKYISKPLAKISTGGKSDQQRTKALNQVLMISRIYKLGVKSEMYVFYRKIIERVKSTLKILK